MDYETKILLSNLIDAVNSTNWWMFGVSVISALASFVVSFMLWRTTKRIGEQQNKIAEYNTYRELYAIIYNIWRFSNIFLFNVEDIIENINDNEVEVEKDINNALVQINTLEKKLREDEVSVMMQSRNIKLADFMNLILYARLIIIRLKQIRKGCAINEPYGYGLSRNNDLNIDLGDKKIIEEIKTFISDNNIKVGNLLWHLNQFASLAHKIFENPEIARIIR